MDESVTNDSDVALMRRICAGQRDRFAELVRRYQPALLRAARSRLRRDDWAEEVVQEAFLAAFKWKHTYDERFSFRTWLWTIMLNQCRARLAWNARTPRVVTWSDEGREAEQSGLYQASLARGGPAPWDRMLARERSELLDRLLDRLPSPQADALRLRFFGGLTFQEIADTLKCSLGTAKNRVRWGLTRLAAMADGNSVSTPVASEGDGGREVDS